MKLFTFGDSWTEGVGGNLTEEYVTDIPEERTIIRQKYCWPKHLSELLECEFINYGVGAFSNTAIFNSILHQLKNEIITKDDFVVIMWSSSLRDPLPFFSTEDDFFIWGKRYKGKQHLLKYIFDGVVGNNVKYKTSEKKFRDYYISNLFNDTYYDIVNQNYILHLQFIFKELGIKYLFCDAFDDMIGNDIISEIDKSNLIDNSRYWGYREKTFADFLIDSKRSDVWEDNNYWNKLTAGKHPNNNGYQLIAEELYKFILNSNLMKPDANKSKNYLI
jgi:lysophospholipase L1-like esterase